MILVVELGPGISERTLLSASGVKQTWKGYRASLVLASWTKHPAGVMSRINWRRPISASRKQQATSRKLQASSLTKKNKGL